MKDVSIRLANIPGALALMGESLAAAGISIEGGGVWVVNGEGIAHFLFEDSAPVRSTLEAAGIEVLSESRVVIQKLKQDVPGQLGKLTRLMEQGGVNIEVQYSDHHNQLILVVDNFEKAQAISAEWTRSL